MWPSTTRSSSTSKTWVSKSRNASDRQEKKVRRRPYLFAMCDLGQSAHTRLAACCRGGDAWRPCCEDACTKSSGPESMQFRSPVGFGPSLNTWPQCAQLASMCCMSALSSRCWLTASGDTGWTWLGSRVPNRICFPTGTAARQRQISYCSRVRVSRHWTSFFRWQGWTSAACGRSGKADRLT